MTNSWTRTHVTLTLAVDHDDLTNDQLTEALANELPGTNVRIAGGTQGSMTLDEVLDITVGASEQVKDD